MAMKWMSFAQAGRPGFGLVVDQSVWEAPADMAQQWPSLWHVVSTGQAQEVAEAILKNPRVWPLAFESERGYQTACQTPTACASARALKSETE
jgi:hypothetical protein